MKNTKNKLSVAEFIKSIEDPVRRKECKTVLGIMKRVTGCRPAMWGSTMVGFDSYTYFRKGSKTPYEYFRTGFSPRKNALTIYIMPGYSDYSALLEKLGPHKTSSGSCLYLKTLDGVDLKTLEKLITAGYKDMNKQYPKT